MGDKEQEPDHPTKWPLSIESCARLINLDIARFAVVEKAKEWRKATGRDEEQSTDDTLIAAVDALLELEEA